MKKTYSGSLALTKLKHTLKEFNGKNGKITCLVIPVKSNHLVEGKEGAYYMPVRVHVRDEEDQYGQHGFVSQSVDSKVWKDADEATKEELKKLPILGNIKTWDTGSANDAIGRDDDIEMPGDDSLDLPF